MLTKRTRQDGKSIYVNDNQICYTIDVPNDDEAVTYETVHFSNGAIMVLKKEEEPAA